MTKEEAKQKIVELVTKYESLSPSEIKGFHEAKTKQGFIEPLFRALGWDFDDTNEIAPEEKASNGRVDYAFKLKGVSQFYLEAKALKADLTNPDYIKQAVTYAYNKGVTWAVLTDFEELRLFNAQANTPFLTFTYKDYTTNFDKLWLLSRESLENGVLNKEAAQYGALQTPVPIETRLFKQLRQWREDLFNQLHLYNKGLSFTQIDEVIQKLFNRLIFIRTCEDKGIEEKKLRSVVNQWKNSGHKGEMVDAIKQIFRDFDGYYDSDLFARHLIDNDEVFIMGTTLEQIIDGLYEIPGGLANYDFNIIDADVLGAVYEQYLGYVAQVVKQRVKEAQAKLDLGIQTESITLTEKKQRRKEHGIYYTPKFVTSYIVRETVGRFLEERSYNEILNMKILDPACGSGSFLIRAYDELLNYHAYQRSKPVSALDQWERLPILTNNIFGVDLDIQAIEIARLNLLLRSLAKRETLPSLADNIQQGNSLISGNEEELKGYFGDNWRDKKPFNWEQEFKDIMSQGGFDVVISNPPYVGFHGFKEDKGYFRNVYEACQGRFDIYLPFIERGMKLLKEGGLLGFICPTNFTKRQYGQTLRRLLKANYKILQIIDFQDQQVFEEALNYTGIFILEKSKPFTKHCLVYIPKTIDGERLPVEQSMLQDNGWVFRDKTSEQIVAKIKARPSISLVELTDGISEGIVTGKNQVFLLPLDKANKLGLEKELLKPAIQGRQIQRYFHKPAKNVLIYPYREEEKTELIPQGDLSHLFPVTWDYLCSQRQNLTGRKYFDESSKAWYELWCERSFLQQASNKIIVPELASTNRFACCEESIFYLDTACGILPKDKDPNTNLYLLGLLNSSLLEFYYKKTTVPKASGFYIYKTMFLEQLPIRRIDFDNPTEKKFHDDLVALVGRMLELNKRLAPIRDTYCNERDELLREIERTDKEIDNLVYDLYELTEEERKIVEGGFLMPQAKIGVIGGTGLYDIAV